MVVGIICLRLWDSALMMSMTVWTFSSSTPTRMVTLPAIRKPPVVASLVEEKPLRVRDWVTALASSWLMIARISFISIPPWIKDRHRAPAHTKAQARITAVSFSIL